MQERVVRVGQMPGRIIEVLVGENTSIKEALDLAGFSITGYEVRVDSDPVTNLDAPVGGANLITLVKQIKGA